MIISRLREYVFVSTPKTGTHTLYKILQDHFDGQKMDGPYHRRKVPDFASSFFLFTTVRHPIQRFLSAYNSLTNFAPYQDIYRAAIGHLDVESFIAWTSDQDWRHPPKLRGIETLIPMSIWLDSLPLQRCIKLEDLKNELRRLPFVDTEIETPHLLSRPHGKLGRRVSTPKRRKIQSIYESDFAKFGYTF